MLVEFYKGLSHKDWLLPDSQIWLAEIDLAAKKLQTKCKNIDYFLPSIPIYGNAKKPGEKKAQWGRANFGIIKFSSSPFASKMPVSENQFT